MARRALRRIGSGLDLSRHFKLPDQLPRPWDAADLFGRHAPLVVEVGSGKGLFLASAAQDDPTSDFLGVEIALKYARFSAIRLVKLGLSNAVVVNGDAQALFRELLPDDSLAAVHVYFPDPWWKARHKKRRVMNEPFVKQIERTLRPGGRLHFWTDVEAYFRAAANLLAEQTRLSGPIAVSEKPVEHDLDYRTHFERRTRLHGEPVYRAEFKKCV